MLQLNLFSRLIPNSISMPRIFRGFTTCLNPSRPPSSSLNSSNSPHLSSLRSASAARSATPTSFHLPTRSNAPAIAARSAPVSNQLTNLAMSPVNRIYVNAQTSKSLHMPSDQVFKLLNNANIQPRHHIKVYQQNYEELRNKMRTIEFPIAIPDYRRIFCFINAKTMVRVGKKKKGFNANYIYTYPKSRGRLIGGMMPDPNNQPNMQAFNELCAENNVGLIIDLTEGGEHDLYEDSLNCDIDITRTPTPDHAPISHEILDNLAYKIYKALKEGKTIYVHCKGGNGRTGIVLTMVRMLLKLDTLKKPSDLLAYKDFQLANEALEEVRKARRHDMVNIAGYIDLVEYAEVLLEKRKSEILKLPELSFE
jgi:protein tyrosine phosphatase